MLSIRPAQISDLIAITEIYNEAIANTTATFDTEPKTVDQRKKWFDEHDEKHPVIVALENEIIVGFASLSRWSERIAYDGTSELSVYVHHDFRGKGIGKKLMEVIVAEGKNVGLHTLISRITTDNQNSIHIHELCGFKSIGIMKQVGNKFGRMLDVEIMQKML